MSRDLFVYRCPYCNGLARHDSYYRDYICRDCGKRFTKSEKYRERPIGDYVNATRNLDRAADIYFSMDISHQDGYSLGRAREIIKALKAIGFVEKDETNYGRAATAHFVVAEALALTQQTLTRDSMRSVEDDARVGALLRQCASEFPSWSAANLLDSFLGAESNLDHADEQRAVMAAAYLLAQEQFRER
jgi:hypothetical protein